MVVDPFKLDYSPAKVKPDTSIAAQYQKYFKSSFALIEKGELPNDLSGNQDFHS